MSNLICIFFSDVRFGGGMQSAVSEQNHLAGEWKATVKKRTVERINSEIISYSFPSSTPHTRAVYKDRLTAQIHNYF